MTLLTPAALWTLAALALPLAIHLWRRPPRTVWLGSLRFLQSHPRRLQNLRWREHVLLFVRLGLLTMLAFLLARPAWRQPPATRPARWALLDPAAVPAGPSLDRLHALQSGGFETRLLAPGFPAIRVPPADPAALAPDLWSLLREADATLPAGSSLAVFSPGRLASLHGVRPSLVHCRVEWVETLSLPQETVAGALPPPPLTVLILHDADRAEDARYVAAALRAVAQTDKRALTISVVSANTTLPAPAADWIFWLSAQPVPLAVADHAAHLLEDETSPVATANAAPSWIVPQPGIGMDMPLTRLWQRVPPLAGSVIWTDGFGQPLLTRTDTPQGTRWHFASRFQPAWNDLPLGTALPASLRALLASNSVPLPADADRRLADPSQCLPSDFPTAALPPPTLHGAEIDGRPPLWLLAALLFCLERILSHRRAPLFASAAPAPTAEPALAR